MLNRERICRLDSARSHVHGSQGQNKRYHYLQIKANRKQANRCAKQANQGATVGYANLV